MSVAKPRNVRLRPSSAKVCAYCKAPGAKKKCHGCMQRTYCNKKCQKKDWKQTHRMICEKLQQVFVPPPAGCRDAKEAAERDGGGGAAAAASGGGCGAAADDLQPCAICLDNEDNAVVDGEQPALCFACGQCESRTRSYKNVARFPMKPPRPTFLSPLPFFFFG